MIYLETLSCYDDYDLLRVDPQAVDEQSQADRHDSKQAGSHN